MNQYRYLSDDKIHLRVPEPYDLDTVCRWENDTELWSVGSSHAPLSVQMIEEYIAGYNPDIYAAKQLRMMITRSSDSATLGAVDLYDFDPHNRRAGVGIIIDKEFQRQGYGTRALNLMIAYFSELLGMHQVFATIPTENEASIKLFKKSGFKICGRYRSWLRHGARYTDVFALQLLFT